MRLPVLGCALFWALPGAPPAHAERTASALQLPLAGATGRLTSLQLSADRLSFLPRAGGAATGLAPRAGLLRLSGRVHVRLDQVSIRAQQIEIELDPAGRALRLEARGALALQATGHVGQAQRLRWLAGARRLILEGDAQVTSASLGLKIAGRRIDLQLDTGELTVDRAHADLARGTHVP
ncbi:MAG: hypothetical protein IT371_24815 [Deltaproteobacteria bacterium]|nr:hypothetical protein [Deltaproteobacteria bacterium]